MGSGGPGWARAHVLHASAVGAPQPSSLTGHFHNFRTRDDEHDLDGQLPIAKFQAPKVNVGKRLPRRRKMMMRIEKRLWVIAMALAALAFIAPPVAFSQSCALCYTQAASAGTRLIEALRSGILVLIIPPMFMSVGITIHAYRKRNQFRNDDYSDE